MSDAKAAPHPAETLDLLSLEQSSMKRTRGMPEGASRTARWMAEVLLSLPFWRTLIGEEGITSCVAEYVSFDDDLPVFWSRHLYEDATFRFDGHDTVSAGEEQYLADLFPVGVAPRRAARFRFSLDHLRFSGRVVLEPFAWSYHCGWFQKSPPDGPCYGHFLIVSEADEETFGVIFPSFDSFNPSSSFTGAEFGRDRLLPAPPTAPPYQYRVLYLHVPLTVTDPRDGSDRPVRTYKGSSAEGGVAFVDPFRDEAIVFARGSTRGRPNICTSACKVISAAAKGHEAAPEAAGTDRALLVHAPFVIGYDTALRHKQLADSRFERFFTAS